MVKVKKMQRLADLESHPIYSPKDLFEWYELRKWIVEENLIDEYREQEYFKARNEITKVQPAPIRPSILKRIFLRLFSKI